MAHFLKRMRNNLMISQLQIEQKIPARIRFQTFELFDKQLTAFSTSLQFLKKFFDSHQNKFLRF